MSDTDQNSDEENRLKKAEINAKREARRRKILENAQIRLQKLNGRIPEKPPNGDIKTNEIYPDPEIEVETINYDNYNYAHNNLSGFNTAGADQQQSDLLQFLNQFPPTPPIESRLSKILKTKAHLALISIITYVLFHTGNENLISYSVFFPLLMWELAEALWLKPYYANKGSLLSIVFMMGGVSPNNSTALMKTFETMNKIFKDVGVFIFFFVMCHLFALNFFYQQEFNMTTANDV